ncbi:MAG: alanine racemase [Holdemanella sp.]|nr:alanine racemase [Holdemanella sp.]
MLEAYSRCWTEIDYDAIEHNVKEVYKLIGNTKLMAIVKANAYGHGAVACTRKLVECGVDFFGVSSIDEAIELREAGICENILILGYTPVEHFHYLSELNIVQSLVSYAYACKLDAYAKKNNIKIRCHCKVDTGMCRTGVIYQSQQKDMKEIIDEYHLKNLSVEGIFSHLPVSDELDEESKSFTVNQIQLFKEVLNNLEKEGINPGICHLQNSYGILNYGDLKFDYCRAGLLYMGVTSDDSVETLSKPDFIPILSLYANVSMVKWLREGMTVSYGRHYTVTKPTKVATLSIGYADGLTRLVSNKGLEVLIHGVKCPIIGNVCMDQCMVDITGVEDVQEGDVACIIGKQNGNVVTVDEITRKSKTINYETLSLITARVPRLEKRG